MSEVISLFADFHKMCRLCLAADSVLVDVYSFCSQLNCLVSDAVMTCTPVQVDKEDKLPGVICKPCHHQLLIFTKFQKKAIESAKKLRQYLQLLPNDISSVGIKKEPLDITNEYYETGSQNLKLSGFSGHGENTKPLFVSECLTGPWKPIKEETRNCFRFGENSDNADTPNDCSSFDLKKVSSDITSEYYEIRNRDLKTSEDEDKGENTEPWFESVYLTTGPKKQIKEEFENCFHFEGSSEKAFTKPTDENFTDSQQHTTEGMKFSFSTDTYDKDIGETKVLSINDHKAINTNEKSLKCDVCNKGFSLQQNLNRHKLIHTGEKPYKCDVCNKGFSDQRYLKSHKATHTGEKPYKCDVCKKSFPQESVLKRHKVTHSHEKPYKCDVCKKGFSWQYHLKSHQVIHTLEMPYKCNECQKSFSHQSALNRHKVIHTGEKPCKCDGCIKNSSQLSVFDCYKATHIGEKPYKCDVCNKDFSEQRYLKSHKIIHTGEKPYKCDVCYKSFSRQHRLRSHQLIHTGEKPYKCDVCIKSFSQKHHLKNHKLIHTRDM